MFFNYATKNVENNCDKIRSNKLDKYIKDYSSGGVVTLPERQFNCPSCIRFEKPTCQIPLWMKPPFDGLYINSY